MDPLSIGIRAGDRVLLKDGNYPGLGHASGTAVQILEVVAPRVRP